MSVIKQIDHVLTQLSTFFEDKKLFCILILLLVLCGVYLYFIEIEGFRRRGFRRRGFRRRGRSGGGGSSEGKQAFGAARGNVKKIGKNLKKIGKNLKKIGKNLNKIRTNKDKIGTNKDKIRTNKDKIGTNKDKIRTNKDKIGTNKDKIETNTGNIGTNSRTIDDIKSLAQNARDLAMAADKKASSVKGIALNTEKKTNKTLELVEESKRSSKNAEIHSKNAEGRVNEWSNWGNYR